MIVQNPNGTYRKTAKRKTKVLSGNVIRTYVRSSFSEELSPPTTFTYPSVAAAAFAFFEG